jgi:hypothetical protein
MRQIGWQDGRSGQPSSHTSGATMTQYPPPGAPQDGPPPGTWPPPGPSGPGPAGQVPGGPYPTAPYPTAPTPGGPAPLGQTPWGPPVHQPGVVPLRPLTLGDILGGALQTVRRNPKATVGVAAVVTFGFMLIPILGTLLLGISGAMPSYDLTPAESTGPDAGDIGLFVSSLVSGVFSMLASIVVTGLIVRVVEQALVGAKISAGEAWQLSRSRLLPLLGLTLLVGLGLTLVLLAPIALGVAVGLVINSTPVAVLLGILGGLLGVTASVFLFTRYVLLAAPSLVLEGHGVFDSLARAAQLSRGQFWRLLGIYLLANLITSFVSQVITIPFSLLGVGLMFVVPESWGLASMLLVTNVATVLTGALVGPFNAAVLALQYYDQRFRKEGLDIQLLNQSLHAGPR